MTSSNGNGPDGVIDAIGRIRASLAGIREGVESLGRAADELERACGEQARAAMQDTMPAAQQPAQQRPAQQQPAQQQPAQQPAQATTDAPGAAETPEAPSVTLDELRSFIRTSGVATDVLGGILGHFGAHRLSELPESRYAEVEARIARRTQPDKGRTRPAVNSDPRVPDTPADPARMAALYDRLCQDGAKEAADHVIRSYTGGETDLARVPAGDVAAVCDKLGDLVVEF